MQYVQLGKQNEYAIVDDDDAPLLLRSNWTMHRGYVVTYIRTPNKTQHKLKMHRLIMGLPGPKVQVDHKDGDRLNNQKSNLRICTSRQNAFNIQKGPDTNFPYKGISYDKGKNRYRARINFNGNFNIKTGRVELGKYKTQEEAALAYDIGALVLHRQFANLNFEDRRKEIEEEITACASDVYGYGDNIDPLTREEQSALRAVVKIIVPILTNRKIVV